MLLDLLRDKNPARRLLCGFLFVLSIGAAQAQLPLLQSDGQEQSFRAYVSGYSFYDNIKNGPTPNIYPIFNEFAGGVGTYSDPITLAVGHVQEGIETIPDFPAGTRFYLPRLRKYALVEDLCNAEVDCHGGQDGLPWMKIYVDGFDLNQEMSDKCALKVTNIQTMIMDPGPNHSVVVGPLSESGCFTFPDL